MHVLESYNFYFISLISCGNIININISTTELSLSCPAIFQAIYVPLNEYNNGVIIIIIVCCFQALDAVFPKDLSLQII